MPKYLIEASYTQEGVKSIQSAGGSARRDAVAHLAESVGGSLESFHFAFGGSDVYAIIDAPDNESAASAMLAVNGSGSVTTKTVVLLTPEEVDAAAKRSADYRRRAPDGPSPRPGRAASCSRSPPAARRTAAGSRGRRPCCRCPSGGCRRTAGGRPSRR